MPYLCKWEKKKGTTILLKVKFGYIDDMVVGAKTSSVSINSNVVPARQAAYLAANVAEQKKSLGTLVLDVKKVTSLAEFFVICGATSQAQARAILGGIEKALDALGYKPLTVEGKADGRWVLIDYGSIIVHIMQERERAFYDLEKFWNHALLVDKANWIETQ